jgi:hypothetical protein
MKYVLLIAFLSGLQQAYSQIPAKSNSSPPPAPIHAVKNGPVSSRLTPVKATCIHTAASASMQANGYSQYYGGYFNDLSYTYHNDFMQVVYPVKAGDRIRVRGNFYGVMPMVIFFSDSTLIKRIANGMNRGTTSITYYDFNETVPDGAGYAAVQQFKGADIKPPFTEMVELQNEVYTPKKIVLIGDSFTQMAGHAEELMNLVKPCNAGYDLYNYGIGGERTIEICGRLGTMQMLLENEVTLPADTSLARIGTTADSGIISGWDKKTALKLLMQETTMNLTRLNPVSIHGISCTLSYTAGIYYLNRSVASTTASVFHKYSAVIPNSANPLNKEDIAIVNIGQNGIYLTNDELIEQVKQTVRNLGTSKFIVLSSHYAVASGDTLDATVNRTIQESGLLKEFGSKYINMREYFSTRAIYDGVANKWFDASRPTATDLEYMKLGMYPPCFWVVPDSRNDIIHLSRASYNVLYKYIFDRMVALHYLD